jgi:hypothetical protein
LQFGLETYFLAQSAVLAFVPDADEVTDHGSEYFTRTRVTHHVLRGGTYRRLPYIQNDSVSRGPRLTVILCRISVWYL